MSYRLAWFVLVAACASDPESCPQSLADYCTPQTCPMTWTAAQDPASWPCGSGNGPTIALTTCGDRHVASLYYVDTGRAYYYDASGSLVRVEDYVIKSTRCLAGDAPKFRASVRT